jgi:hypothetical protein
VIGLYICWPSFALSVARCTVLVRACEREGSGFVVGAVSLLAVEGIGGGIAGPDASVERLERL